MESLIHNQLKTLFTLALHRLSTDQGGLVFSDGFRVRLPAPGLPETARKIIVQPDCFYVSRRTVHSSGLFPKDKSNPTCFPGAPDVVVEVASPKREEIDRVVKMEQYARAGVREYWLTIVASRLDEHIPGPAGYPGLDYDLFFRIHSLDLLTGAYRTPDAKVSPLAKGISRSVAYSQFFNVRIGIARQRKKPPGRCRLTIDRTNGRSVMFVV